MPTEALKSLVLPVLNCAPFTYDIRGKADTVTFTHKFPEFTGDWRVVDYPKSHVLSIEALDIVSFPLNAPWERASECSDKSFGKFTLVKEINKPELDIPFPYFSWVKSRLRYVLELPYVDETTPAAFAHALALAFDTVGINYEGWLQAETESREKDLDNDKGLFERIEEAFGTANTTQRSKRP